eukprot:786937-Rhodomonas_salina.1
MGDGTSLPGHRDSDVVRAGLERVCMIWERHSQMSAGAGRHCESRGKYTAPHCWVTVKQYRKGAFWQLILVIDCYLHPNYYL